MSGILQWTAIPILASVLQQGNHTAKWPFADKISFIKADITRLQVDAIVNAANNSLLGGGGVDEAIHTAAGSQLLEECKTLDGCETGDAKTTKAYQLPAKFVIHTVGPVYSESKKQECQHFLRSAYKTSLEQAVKYQAKTIAFPSISTGVYGYPFQDACHQALLAVGEFLEQNPNQIDRIIFCCFSETDYTRYLDLAPHYFG